MELYDSVIKSAMQAFAGLSPKVRPLGGEGWQSSDRNEILFQKDTAFELGGGGKPCVSFTAVTSAENLFPAGSVLVYGKDLSEIEGDVPFAKITLVRADGFSEDSMQCYNAVKDIEFVAYDVFLKGVMSRISVIDRKEQLRISKSALSEGISFEKISNSYAEEYKKNPNVHDVSFVYVTENNGVFPVLRECARKADEITLALNKVLSGMNFDCATCNLKAVCDEVEGLRELHFKNKK